MERGVVGGGGVMHETGDGTHECVGLFSQTHLSFSVGLVPSLTLHTFTQQANRQALNPALWL